MFLHRPTSSYPFASISLKKGVLNTCENKYLPLGSGLEKAHDVALVGHLALSEIIFLDAISINTYNEELRK